MATYHYRADATRREILPALRAGAGAGLAVGAVVAYLTQLLLRRRDLPAAPAAPAADAVRLPARGGR